MNRQGMHRAALALSAILFAAGPDLARAQFFTGACCFDNGTCNETNQTVCTLLGGDFQGNGTTCSPNPCIGACCFTDGSCLIQSMPLCQSAGGMYQGGGTSCTPNPCPQPTGACCLTDGTCTVQTQADCTAAGGAYGGDGTPCTPNPCIGACCFPDGSCTDGTQPDCAAAGGTYQGDGTDCASAACPQPGACCFLDGTCAAAAQLGGADCLAACGTYQGDGTACTPNPCAGACCFCDGSCSSLTQDECLNTGGSYQGDGIACFAASCTAPSVSPTDTCTAAPLLPCDAGTFPGFNTGAATDGASSCGGVADLWWRYTAPFDGEAALIGCLRDGGGVLSVYDGCAGTELLCAVGDDCVHLLTRPRVVFPINAGLTYWIRLAKADVNIPDGDAFLTIVATPSSPPAILRHPLNQTRVAGSAAIFRLTAVGVPQPAYQWMKDGSDIPGATGSSYAIAAVASGDEGLYSCRVTTATGQATSLPANLTVLASAPQPCFVPVGSFVVGSQPADLVAAQLDGDSFMDLGVVNTGSDSVSILLGTAGESFQPPIDVSLCFCQQPAPCNAAASSIAAGLAVGGDERIDLVLATASGVLAVKNLGGGAFALAGDTAAGGTLMPDAQAQILFSDINAAGTADLVALATPVLGQTQSVTSRLGDGGASGIDAEGNPLNVQNSGPPLDLVQETAALAIGFFDGDLFPDLISAWPGTNQVSLFRNLGTDDTGCGQFVPCPQFLGWQSIGSFAVDPAPVAVVAADLDGDGRADVATANHDAATVSILLNDGADPPALGPRVDLAVGAAPAALAAADLDGDGDLDLAVAESGSDSISILLNDGSGGFQLLASVLLPPGSAPAAVAAGDFTGDGLADLATADGGSGKVTLIVNNTCLTCAGDGDGDARLDGRDIQPFVDCMLAGPAVTLHCACADIDGDGTIGAADLAAFVESGLLSANAPACP